MIPFRLYVIRCEFPSTHLNLQIKAKSRADALRKAQRDSMGKHALTWTYLYDYPL